LSGVEFNYRRCAMPEAFAVVLVSIISLAIYVFARFEAGNPNAVDPSAELSRLREQQAWHEQRLQQAERENWSHEMRARIAAELEATVRQLTETAAAAGRRT
jgi:hypothetical protein